MNSTRCRDLMTGVGVTLAFFFVANLIAVHVRSDFGLLAGLGIVDANDDIRRIGFPFQFFEEGGFVHRREFSPVLLLVDIALAFACSAAVGLAFVWIRKQFEHAKV